MKVNDKRQDVKYISWNSLMPGEIYICVTKQKYMLATSSDEYIIDVDSGDVYTALDYKGVTENFIHCPNATLELK